MPSRDRAQALGRPIAIAILLVLTTVNFLNYLDRYVLSAVLEDVSGELGLSDSQSGLLATMFLLVYTLAAPFGGYIGDRWKRNRIVAVAVALWSFATIGCGFVDSYEQLLGMRALIGIGEAGYAIVAPSIIADLFRPRERGRRLAFFYLAIPMGSALGYLVGGAVGEAYGWRTAFHVAGAPGLLFALLALLLPEPIRGVMDDEEPAPRVPMLTGLRRVLRTPAWVINTIGMSLMTFTMGGLAFWMPTFLVRARNMTVGDASMVFGGITVVAGLLATLTGGYLGDRAYAKHAGGYFWISGIGLLIGAPFVAVLPYIDVLWLLFAVAFVAEFFLFLNTGPLNAALVACVPANLRASAVAFSVFALHAFGDASSPLLIGLVSEASSLSLGLALTAIPIMIGGVVLLWGARAVRGLPNGLLTVRGESEEGHQR